MLGRGFFKGTGGAKSLPENTLEPHALHAPHARGPDSDATTLTLRARVEAAIESARGVRHKGRPFGGMPAAVAIEVFTGFAELLERREGAKYLSGAPADFARTIAVRIGENVASVGNALRYLRQFFGKEKRLFGDVSFCASRTVEGLTRFDLTFFNDDAPAIDTTTAPRRWRFTHDDWAEIAADGGRWGISDTAKGNPAPVEAVVEAVTLAAAGLSERDRQVLRDARSILDRLIEYDGQSKAERK